MSRTSGFGSSVSYGDSFRSYNGAPNAYTATSVAESSSWFRNSTVTPGFAKFKVSNSGAFPNGLPHNFFHYIGDRYKSAVGYILERDAFSSANVRDEGYLTTYYGSAFNVPSVVGPSPAEIASMRAQVDRKLLEKLKEQSVNLAQVFAERAKTATMIGNTAIMLANSLRSLRRGDIRGAARAIGAGISQRKVRRFNRNYRVNRVDAVANGWLQLQYGWRPLLQDIYGSAELLAKQQNRELSGRVRSRVSRQIDGSFTEDIFSRYTHFSDRTSRFDYSGQCTFVTSGAALASARSMGLTNPLSLAWELVPYSFVADWFIPIGDYLNTLDATLGLSFQDGSYTTFLKGRSVSKWYGNNRSASSRYYPWALWTTEVAGNRELVECVRTRMNNFPVSTIPSFRNPFSFERSASAVALLIQLFRRGN